MGVTAKVPPASEVHSNRRLTFMSTETNEQVPAVHHMWWEEVRASGTQFLERGVQCQAGSSGGRRRWKKLRVLARKVGISLEAITPDPRGNIQGG